MKRKESCPLQTTALEEKIKQLSADYIYEQAVGSLLLMLMSAMEDVEKATRLCLTPYMKICWLSKKTSVPTFCLWKIFWKANRKTGRLLWKPAWQKRRTVIHL